MRLYFAIRPPLDVRKKIVEKIHPILARSGRSLNVQRMEHLHITTHFIGEVTPERAEEIIEGFKHCSFPAPVKIRLGGKPVVGTFGNGLLYLRVTDSAFFLHALKEEGAFLAPVKDAYSKYTPHLTLARNPKKGNLDTLVRTLNAQPLALSFTPSDILLIHSHEENGVKHHDIIAKHRLSRGKKGPKRREH